MIALQDTLSTSTQQRVAILDAETLQPIFQSAEPMRLSVRESKRATKFAVEDGSERSDHVVKELTEIQIDLLLTDDTRNQFDGLRQAYLQNKLVTLQTKVASYENLLILDLPHDETADLGAAINVPVRLQEWLEVKPEYGPLPPAKVANKNQSSTVQRGQQTGKDADEGTERKGSVLSGVFG
ncbi:FIG00431858: hypothetical protein [plant metagenome]|uniref:Dit-like phage tail protein N-terminal domain-containing protein n=1 Tax=plant metagenome TaxID=1297885 RepID=A0A484Q2D0_9ZZZZ